MTDRTATLTFSDGSPPVTFPVLSGHRRTGRHRHPHAVRQDRQVHLRPGIHVDGSVQLGDHLHRRRQGRAPLSRLSDRGARVKLRLHGVCHLLLYGELPTRAEKAEFVDARDASHDGQRADAVLHARLPPRRAPDGGADGAGRRAVGVLPRLDEPARSAAARHLGDPADRQDAHAGRDGLQVFGRPAVHVSAQRSVVRRATSCA